MATTDPEALAVYSLTRDEAALRSANVSDVNYRLRLKVAKGTAYEGRVDVSFNVTHEQAPALWLDFKATEVHELIVNGTAVAEISWTNGKLHLGSLPQGANQVIVRFKNDYAKNGCGLHHFVDPEDSLEYLYTQFEPFYAHRMFPCFDQPDIKAELQLSVAAPAEWKVISNTPIIGSEDSDLTTGEGEAVTVFKPTLRISTYLYALCAGPYAEFRINENESGIPLGFYCRQTLAKYMVVERYSIPTIRGFVFYNEFFNYVYPFEKYDQIFVPEFNFGAMENVGCVTYRDQFLFKDPPSHNQLMSVCHVFLHEMAHMWFGNLVTMKWWDDLWLNESFADYICMYASSKVMAQEHPETWQYFLVRKGWGYATDQLPTTHPISLICSHTAQVDTLFDGISYSKGAAVLKQLNFVVGEDNFRAGLRNYMQKFQFSNATFDDLITELNAETEHDMHEWANSWVKTAGLNEVEPVITASAEGLIERFEIVQTPALSQHPTLRSHKILVELYDADLNLRTTETVQVEPSERTTVASLVGAPAPAFVLLNAGDKAFVKVIIEPSSLPLLRTGLSRIQDPLSRQLVYRALWDMVRDLKLSGAEFVDILSSQLADEGSLYNITYTLDIASSALSNYVPSGAAKDNFFHQIFTAILGKIANAPDVTTAVQLSKYVYSYARHADDVATVVQWLTANETGVPNLTLEQGDRWHILKIFSVRDVEQSKALVADELLRDKSDSGNLASLYCANAVPTSENKAEWWGKYTGPDGLKLSRYERNSAMSGFNQARQKELLASYSDAYFGSLLNVIATTDQEFSYDFASNLFPAYVDETELVEKVSQILPSIGEQYSKLLRFLKEEVDILPKYKRGKLLSEEYIARLEAKL